MSVECPECGKVLKNGSGLAGHLKIQHGINAKDSKEFRKVMVSEKAYSKIEQLVDLWDEHNTLMSPQYELEGKEEDSPMTFLDAFDAKSDFRKKVMEVVEAKANEVFDKMQSLYDELVEDVQNGGKGKKKE